MDRLWAADGFVPRRHGRATRPRSLRARTAVATIPGGVAAPGGRARAAGTAPGGAPRRRRHAGDPSRLPRARRRRSARCMRPARGGVYRPTPRLAWNGAQRMRQGRPAVVHAVAFLAGLISHAPATIRSTMTPGTTASQVPVAARAPAPAQPVEDSASAKVATRDEVCRRRKTTAPGLSAKPDTGSPWPNPPRCAMPTSRDQRGEGRGGGEQRRQTGANTTATPPSTASVLARSTRAGRHRRRGDEFGRVLAGHREPGEAAGQLPGRHDQDRHHQRWGATPPAEKLRHSRNAGGSR